jgi:hypothetical protein
MPSHIDGAPSGGNALSLGFRPQLLGAAPRRGVAGVVRMLAKLLKDLSAAVELVFFADPNGPALALAVKLSLNSLGQEEIYERLSTSLIIQAANLPHETSIPLDLKTIVGRDVKP